MGYIMSHSSENLKTLQNQFQANLIDFDEQIISSIQSSSHFNAHDRLAVYSDGYYLRLVDILAKNFPMLKLFCGEDKFDDAAFAYLSEHPSRDYSLYQLGKYFSIFLGSYFSSEPVISELAAFEWAFHEVLLAGNARRIGTQALLDLTPEQWPAIKLVLHPAIRFLHLKLNTPIIWRALHNQQDLPKLESSPCDYLIWRFHLAPYFCALNPEQKHIFTSIQAGSCFAEICENLIGHMPEEEIGGFVAGVLQQWLKSGVFIAF